MPTSTLALTFDAFSGGRLLINSVNGRENILTKYDMNVPHDERYELGEQYWADFRRIYAEGTESNFPNTPLRIDAPAGHQVPLWGTGDSPAGLANSGKVLDTYLAMLRETSFIEDKFSAARAAAEGYRGSPRSSALTRRGAASGPRRRQTMARRKAEVAVVEASDALITAADIEMRWPARESASTVGASMTDDLRHAALDALTARLSAIPSMTDRAAINALAEAVADLARLMR